jgi:sirohydrochlorin ferrochelatase
MEALLLIAHGSRRQQSNQEVTELADQLRAACDASYKIVHAAFLELASPSIGEGISLCVDDGASRVTLLPYFLNSGRHVVEDIPEIVGEAKIQHPDIDIIVAPHLGASSLMVDLLIDSARTAHST